MPPGQANHFAQVADITRYLDREAPKAAINYHRALDAVLLAFKRREADDNTLILERDALKEMQDWMPASQLFEAMTPDLSDWAPWVKERIPEILVTKAFTREYRQAFRACLKRAKNGGAVSSALVGLTEAWIDTRSLLAHTLPFTDRALEDLIAKGQTVFNGVRLDPDNKKRTKNEFRIMLHGYTAMAHHMMSLGIRSPSDVRPEHLVGDANSWYQVRKAGKAHDLKVYYCSKASWYQLAGLRPDLNLISWPEPNLEREYGLKLGERPALLEAMLDEISALDTLDSGTIRNIRVNSYRLLGYYQKRCGLDVPGFCEALGDPEDLAWLLYGPYSPTEGGKLMAPLEEVRRIIEDSEYRNELLRSIPHAARLPASQVTCRDNPFQKAFTDWSKERGKFEMAKIVISSFRLACQHYLPVNKSQFDWSMELKRKLLKAKRRAPSAYWASRKEALSQDPDLWKKLVAARGRMSEESEAWRLKAERAKTPEARYDRELHYAIALRDELAIGMLLAFQLRNTNVLTLRIGDSLFPDEYRISIAGQFAKAHDRINKRFHERGPLADLKSLLDSYLIEGRPLLLPDGEETPYLFLPFPGEKCTRDKEGFLMLGVTGLNRIVRKACERHFRDLFPMGLDRLTAHLFRDLFANMGYRAPGGGDIIAAQGLANTVETMRNRYLGLHRTSDDEVRSFIESLDVSAVAKDPNKRRKEVRALIEKQVLTLDGMSQAESDAHVNRLMRIFERFR